MITEGKSWYKMTAGVPQGSALGPTLWNVLYDDVLRKAMPPIATLVAFAEVLAVATTAKDEDTLKRTVNDALQRIEIWMNDTGVQLAP